MRGTYHLAFLTQTLETINEMTRTRPHKGLSGAVVLFLVTHFGYQLSQFRVNGKRLADRCFASSAKTQVELYQLDDPVILNPVEDHPAY